jgi:hypothetical protein
MQLKDQSHHWATQSRQKLQNVEEGFFFGRRPSFSGSLWMQQSRPARSQADSINAKKELLGIFL